MFILLYFADVISTLNTLVFISLIVSILLIIGSCLFYLYTVDMKLNMEKPCVNLIMFSVCCLVVCAMLELLLPSSDSMYMLCKYELAKSEIDKDTETFESINKLIDTKISSTNRKY